MTATGPTVPPDVELRVPAEGAYVSVLRTATAALAARLDFTLEDVEDLRVAVGEAAGLVLDSLDPDAVDRASLSARFWLGERRVTVAVSGGGAPLSPPDEDSFAWTVLTTLTESAQIAEADGERSILLVVAATPLETSS